MLLYIHHILSPAPQNTITTHMWLLRVVIARCAVFILKCVADFADRWVLTNMELGQKMRKILKPYFFTMRRQTRSEAGSQWSLRICWL